LLAGGGQPSRCGWLKDQFGLSWQIITEALTRLMSDKDSARAGRVVQAMMTMGKIDIAALQAAYDAV
jgi:predicted 3-demethylubiquinone-9 3-methyltransferase (glyoxalase superfamily)